VRPAHAALAALVCVIVPAASWLDGTGFLAWTMFSGSRSYRLELAAISSDGSRRALAPTGLVRYVGIEEAPFFAAADTWRTMPCRGLRLRLAEVGALACRLEPAAEVEITLVTRRTLDSPPESRVERARCDTGP
jgi:hypothetical protein